jgi:hypothetical protein
MSAELGAVLDTVAQATVRGAPKYAPRVTRELTRAVVCRAYSGIIFELTHLMAAAQCAFRAGGYERLFWDRGPAAADRFRSSFERALTHEPDAAGHVAMTIGGIEAAYPDGTFSVSFGRMPLLSAMLDFLVGAIGYRQVDEAVRGAFSAPPSHAAVNAAANRISRALYAYLTPRLPAAQAQRKFRCLMAFLRAHAGAVQPRPEDIGDDAVSAFWMAHAGDPRGDWKTYRTTVAAFIHLRDALAAAAEREAVNDPLPLDPARDAAGPDEACVMAACAGLDRRLAALETLAEAPADAVKFLTKTDVEALSPILAAGDHARALSLSLLRAMVFGTVQAAITQALRRGLDGPDAVSEACGAEAESYPKRLARLYDIAGQVEKASAAAYHVLAKARHGEAIDLFLALNPDLDLRPLAGAVASRVPSGGNVVALGADAAAREFFGFAAAGSGDCPAMGEFAARAAAAHRAISRKGFGADESRDPAVVAGFAAGAPALIEIREALARYLARLEALMPSPRDKERGTLADRSFFFTLFRFLYGGTP